MKKVVVTGGQGDIAQAIANKLKTCGIFEVYLPNRKELDVTSIESVEKYFEEITPDILINNAGFVVPQSIKESNEELDKNSILVNLFGTFNCTAATLKKNENAQIINIGSSAATKIHGTWSAYCAAKAGVVMATRCWAEDGVNTVCISPGRAQTKMRSSLFQNEDPDTLLKPDDFATIIMYAIEGKYSSGAHINVTVENVQDLVEEKKNEENGN